MNNALTSEALANLQVGETLVDGFVSVYRLPDTKTGKLTLSVTVNREQPVCRSSHDCRTVKAALSTVSRFRHWLK